MSKHFLVFVVLFQVLALAGTARAQRVPPPGAVAPGAGVPVRESIVFEGFVLDPDGAPAEGAVVVTSAGGRAVTDLRGRYRLEVEVSPEAGSVQVMAVGAGEADVAASASVESGAGGRQERTSRSARGSGSGRGPGSCRSSCSSSRRDSPARRGGCRRSEVLGARTASCSLLPRTTTASSQRSTRVGPSRRPAASTPT